MTSTALDDVPGLEDYWRRATRRAPARSDGDMADHLLLSVLGLGLEQTLQHLAREQPHFTAFWEWVLATAGPPDPAVVARYRATGEGRPSPPAPAGRLAEIDAMPPALEPAERERFEREGYAVLRAALSREEAERAAAAVLSETGAELADPGTWYG